MVFWGSASISHRGLCSIYTVGTCQYAYKGIGGKEALQEVERFSFFGLLYSVLLETAFPMVNKAWLFRMRYVEL